MINIWCQLTVLKYIYINWQYLISRCASGYFWKQMVHDLVY